MENNAPLSILKDSFWQLMFVYSLFIIAIALGFFSRFSFYFNLFALIIAIIGTLIITPKLDSKSMFKTHTYYFIFALSILYILLFRLIPYWFNGHKIPLGYDTGIYKYAIEHGLQNLDYWVRGGVEPGFLYFMTFLNSFLNIPSDFLLKYGFIFCILVLGLSIYFFTLVYFKNKDIALFAILIYSVSLVQFKVFTYLYYKNIIALSFTLLAFTFLKKDKFFLFTLFGILTGIFHRPSFYIFGLSFLVFSFISPYDFNSKKYDKKLLVKYVLSGSTILAITMLFFMFDFSPAIFNLINPVVKSFVQTGASPGTFIDFKDYQFSILFYLPLSILGLFLYIKSNKKIFYKDVFFYYTFFLIIIVYFQLFFFNRFIIFLDISLIIFSAYACLQILKNGKWGILILSILFISGVVLTFNASIHATPTLPNSIFDSITSIDLGSSQNNYIISISSEYTPYLQGYIKSSKTTKIIAPGMFDYDIWGSKERWELYWEDLNASSLQEHYGNDANIYLFTPSKLENSCYQKVENQLNLYKWIC